MIYESKTWKKKFSGDDYEGPTLRKKQSNILIKKDI